VNNSSSILVMRTVETRPLDYIGNLNRTNCAVLLACGKFKIQCNESM